MTDLHGQFLYRGGAFRDLPTGTGKHRHHLLAKKCLEDIGQNPNLGPAILMDRDDHLETKNWGPGARAQRWREETVRLLRAGLWDEALVREIVDVENVKPGKYTGAIKEARESGLGLWPERVNGQFVSPSEAEALDSTQDGEPEPEQESEPRGAKENLAERSDWKAEAQAFMRGKRGAEEDDLTAPSDWKAEARAFMRGKRGTKDVAAELPPPGRDDSDRGIGD